MLETLEELGRRQMTNILVEGGEQLLGSLFDLGEIDEIHERFGNFVLINTNFGWSNHFLPKFNQTGADVNDEFLAAFAQGVQEVGRPT